MERDAQVIRKILLYVRKNARGDPIPFPSFKEYDKRVVDYHVRLCDQAGFITLHESTMIEGEDEIDSLTWEGQNQLERWVCR